MSCSAATQQSAVVPKPLLEAGTYRLDVTRLANENSFLNAKVVGKLKRADMRLVVTGNQVKQFSNARPSDVPTPTYQIKKSGPNTLHLDAPEGPDMKCVIRAPDIVDCNLPHGMVMRFQRKSIVK